MAEKTDQVSVVGGTGDGRIRHHTIETPAGQPNIEVALIPTALGVLVGFADTFLNTLVSTATVAGVTKLIPFSDFSELLFVGSSVATTAAVIGMLKDLVVIAGRLKKKYPLLSM